MSSEAIAWLHGHGKIVRPALDCRVERGEDDPILLLERAGVRETIDVRSDAIASELCTVEPGTRQGAWRIEASGFACVWPIGFALVADPDSISPFLLLGPGESMIWINGPLERGRAMPIEKLAAPEQRVREVAEAAGGVAARLDLDYEEEGERWWQRRYVIEWAASEGRVVIVSAQARPLEEPAVRAAVELVERTLEPL